MFRRKILISLLFAGVVMVGAQAVEAAGRPKYMGYKGCRGCHKKEYDSWKTSSKARSFDALYPGVNAENKESAGIDVNTDNTKNPKCLRCHATGFGELGGFKSIMETPDLSGVTCEACHGPGQRYNTIMAKKRKSYRVFELIQAGYERPNQDTCNKCHVPGCPTTDDDHEMDYDDSIGHERFPLKYEH